DLLGDVYLQDARGTFEALEPLLEGGERCFVDERIDRARKMAEYLDHLLGRVFLQLRRYFLQLALGFDEVRPASQSVLVLFFAHPFHDPRDGASPPAPIATRRSSLRQPTRKHTRSTTLTRQPATRRWRPVGAPLLQGVRRSLVRSTKPSAPRK